MTDSVGLVEADEREEKRGIKRIRGCGRREREKDPVVPDTQMKRQPTDSFSLEAT